MTGTLAFPVGNLAPQGSVVKSTAIDPTRRWTPTASTASSGRRASSRPNAPPIAAIKSDGPDAVKAGDVLVLAGCGPMGTGMEETYQVTSALTHVPWGKEVAVLTDARFSGVSTGACIGHVSPEALAGGPIGKLVDGDLIRIVIDRRTLEASVDLVGHGGDERGEEWGTCRTGTARAPADLGRDPRLPEDTRLWAALQDASGGTWGGCVYDVEAILGALKAGKTRARDELHMILYHTTRGAVAEHDGRYFTVPGDWDELVNRDDLSAFLRTVARRTRPARPAAGCRPVSCRRSAARRCGRPASPTTGAAWPGCPSRSRRAAATSTIASITPPARSSSSRPRRIAWSDTAA